MTSFFGSIILFIVALSAIGLIVAYVLVPVFRGIGWLIGAFFKSVGWLFAHVFEYIGGTIGDAIRLIGSLLTCIVLLPFAPLNVVLGRWSAAGHFADSLKREAKVAAACVYRIVLRRPLKLFWLHGLLEGVEQRVPEAMAAAPAADKPGRRTGRFDGYEIVGSLPGGGSGAKLYIARPSDPKRKKLAEGHDRVVIKSFALSEGSALPQIVRESRALEAARQLGLVLDHGMDDLRFFYVMPYHAGDHLGLITRQMHARSDGRGLDEKSQGLVMGYMSDLLVTLSRYHAGGLWHKDVKPENIIVHDGRAHLVDLGLVTPLRSAMTLTTHGTEYFRDPELVRQALRGVKVHQVDGGKFDVYAVGAVTYFLIENTFPAHGGLSRFTKKSPEALRWIVKRAMADYNKRYENSDAMLADLRAVMIAPNPFGVRPIDLPSMRGGVPVPDPEPAPEPMFVASETPKVATPGPAAIRVELDETLETPAADAAQVAAAAAAEAPRHPGLRVTNWWTGAYEVGDEREKDAAMHEQAGAFRGHVREMREHAEVARRQVRMNAGEARRAARDQIKAARDRARDLRQRAKAKRHAIATVSEGRQPSAVLGGVVACVVLAAVALPFLVSRMSPNRDPFVGAPSSVAMADGGIAIASTAEDQDLPAVMLVVSGDRDALDEAEGKIARTIEKYRRDGYQVVGPISEGLNEELVLQLADWDVDRDGPADIVIETILDHHRLYGLVRVDIEDRKQGRTRVESSFIYSERDGADERRYPALIDSDAPWAELNARPLLLVNDHPAKNDHRVEERIGLIVSDFQNRRWDVVLDDEVEALIRPVLPTKPVWEITADDLPVRFAKMLEDKGYGGVVLIGASPGDGAAHERIAYRHLDASG